MGSYYYKFVNLNLVYYFLVIPTVTFMITTIRRNCFETNSSSSHSISLSRNAAQFTSFEPDADGVVRLGSGEYGWGYDTFTSAWSKADYAAIDFDSYDQATAALVELIKIMTGAKAVEINVTGYIDHQSIGIARNIYDNDGVEGLCNFIFNTGSTLTIDNDNH